MNTIYLVPFFLGTFSGFLATLPIGPAKILAVRKFLLISKGNENEVYNLKSSNTILLASLCGLIFAQFLFVLALQFPFLYSLWVKPHFFSFFFVLVLFIYLYQIKNIQFDISNNQFLLKSESNFSYQQAAFLETLLLQLLNPVVLPNPVFCRLTNVFLFRYSTISTFFAGNFLGLLSGYGIFFLSTLFLLKRLEEDAPTIYRLVKIKIHQFFGIILVIFSFLCLSRTPLPAIKPFKLKEISTTFSSTKVWYENIWPDSFFGYDRWKRPLRLISVDEKKSQPNNELKPFNKMFFSQFFFEGGIQDGNYRLVHNFPQSLSLISQNINSILNNKLNNSQIESIEKNKNFIDEWIQEKKNRQNQISQNINTKIKHIEKGSYLEELVEKKFSSFDNNKNKISKQMDPRLNADIRGKKFFFKNKSFLFLTKEFFSKKDSLFAVEKKNLIDTYTKNKFKLFLTENSQNLSSLETRTEKIPFITWKPIIQSFYDKNQNLKETSLDQNNVVKDQLDLDGLKNKRSWHSLFKKISPPFSSESSMGEKLINFENELKQEENNSKMAQIYKPMPLWNLNFNKKELNLLKRQSNNKLHLKIFFPKSNHLADRQNFVPPLMPFFRRNEFPGTITSRRGKAVCWNTFQKKPHSPLFIHHLNLLKNFFAKRKKIQINQDVPTKSWQSTSKLFQFLRDYLLSLQAYIRKYLKLPFLIIIKNFIRQLFFQPAEWEKDWTNLSKEVYVQCDFYGKAGSVGVKLPNFFANDEPKQIKIVNPFELRFWTRSFSEQSSLQESENSSFLNVWGRETKMPFGKVKKSPSFWQLFIERIKLILQYKILKNLSVSSSIDSIEIQKEIKNPRIQSQIDVQQNFQIEQSKRNLGTKDEEKVKNLNKKIIDNNFKYKTTKRKIVNNSTQNKTFSDFNKKEKINRTRQYTFQNMSILLQRQWFHFYRLFLKKERELFFELQTKMFEMKKIISRKNTKVIKIFLKLFYNVSRFLRSLYYQISEFFNWLSLKFVKNQKEISSNIDAFDLKPTKNLSQAYIIHSIWEDRMMSRPNITSLMKSWNQNVSLKNNLENFLNKQGILGNEKPENLTEHQWQEWLKNFRVYTPSLKLWALWAPNYWTQAVEQYWKELPSSKLKSILNQEPNKINKSLNFTTSLDNSTLNKFLEPHLPLFQAVQKQKKLWKFNILSRNYTEVTNDGDIDSFFSWQTTDFDKKTHYLFDTLKKVKGKDKNLIVSPINLSSLPQIKENKLKRNLSQQNIKKELPLIQREKKRLDFDIKLQTLRQRGTFFPVSTRRWKLKKLKNKLEKLAKTVIKKPQSGELSSSLTIGEKNKKLIRELFVAENRLFTNILENWNSKVLDDELLMYNTISSILRFANKNINALAINNSDSLSLFPRNILRPLDLNFLLLEDIYLPTYLREMKILEYFHFEKENQNIPSTSTVSHSHFSNKKEKTIYAETINKWHLILQQKQNVIKDRQTIVRFLWPTHRLEDLSCINRFWLGTANQSRFSILRIQTVPNI
uniref:Protein TIC 214 n=1 Tax=Staurastrum punctulatum TaxID=102822 RepID=TI214_STAPU|nr:hypothetical chloroplast RF1 [Staurastrum punctulatum]Q32RZ9.1 RecName: Full=Protein TIC 214; AltName: Full=Translocon at the inner envelope membrane of chloroplasts 214; Short=AtTIC214 [Staurastrum punctulatum]AAX45762.1 hypothetical chloroplast RF1 [Staurastrum punctulatum]